MVYTLADMVARIKIGSQKKSYSIIILTSSFCILNLKIMYDLGYIAGYAVINFKYSKIYLKFYFNNSVIRAISVLSKKKFSVYLKSSAIRNVIKKNYFLSQGFLILSVSQRFSSLTDVECIMLNCGGKALIFLA